MIVNASTLSALNVQINKTFQAALAELDPMIDRIATRVPSSTASNKYPLGGLTGTMREWLGDREIHNIAAYVETVANLKYEHTIAVPKEDIEDDQVGWIMAVVQQMAREGSQHPWREALTALMTNGFSTDYPTQDAKAFFSATHTWANSEYTTAQDNLTDEALDSDAVYTGIQFFDDVRGPNGNRLNYQPDLFLAASNIRSTVDGLFNQATLATGETNPHFGRFSKENQIIGHGIPSGYWAMLCTNAPVKPVVFQERRPFTMTSMTNLTDENVFMRDEFMWGTNYRGKVACIAWWLAYGSTGDGG